MLKTRAMRAQVRVANAQMRQMHPEIPRYLPQGGLLSHAIAAWRRRKSRNGQEM